MGTHANTNHNYTAAYPPSTPTRGLYTNYELILVWKLQSIISEALKKHFTSKLHLKSLTNPAKPETPEPMRAFALSSRSFPPCQIHVTSKLGQKLNYVNYVSLS